MPGPLTLIPADIFAVLERVTVEVPFVDPDTVNVDPIAAVLNVLSGSDAVPRETPRRNLPLKSGR